jgi:hypothetical protein
MRKQYIKNGITVFTLFLFFLIPFASHGQEVTLPSLNLGGTNFLDGMAGPGLLLEETVEYYFGKRFTDSKGKKIPGDNSVESWLFLTHVAYLTKWKILGGYYGVEILLPIVRVDLDTDLGIRDQHSGVGDLILSPFILQWVDHKIFNMPYFHRFNIPFTLPTGRYDKDASVNIGNHLYSFNPYYAFTLFITPKLETSWRIHYLWNSKNHSPPSSFHADSIQPGQAFHLNYAFSYEIINGLRAGLAGYYLQQITEDKVDDHKRDHSKENVFAIGPGLMFSKKGFFVYLNAFYETNSENRPEGMKISVRLSKVF